LRMACEVFHPRTRIDKQHGRVREVPRNPIRANERYQFWVWRRR
jgi:hypothetical protein